MFPTNPYEVLPSYDAVPHQRMEERYWINCCFFLTRKHVSKMFYAFVTHFHSTFVCKSSCFRHLNSINLVQLEIVLLLYIFLILRIPLRECLYDYDISKVIYFSELFLLLPLPKFIFSVRLCMLFSSRSLFFYHLFDSVFGLRS